MHRSYPSYVNCAEPGGSSTYLSLGNIVVNALGSLAFGGLAGGAFALITMAVTGAAAKGCAIGTGVFVFFIAGVWSFENWYRNLRLMCVGGRQRDRCIVGTLADDPALSGFDGDRKIDMLLAPFIFRDEVSADPSTLNTLNCKDYFIAEIREHPELFGPGPVDITETSQLMSYVDGLTEERRTLLYVRVAHERMFHSSVPERHFQRHFQIRDRVQMGDPAFNNSPDDTLAASSPNPMFKMNYRPPLAPFMHCELEGNKWEKILNNIQVGLWAALAAFIAGCAVCIALELPEPACGWIAAGIALLLGLLAWWIANQVNDPDEGDADLSDPDFEDPAADGDQMTVVPGDALLIFGEWIMDEEHTKQFELHPIRSIHLICYRRGAGDTPWEIVDDLSGDFPRSELCPYPMETVTAEDYALMCGMVDVVERTDPVIEKHVPSGQALSMYAGFR